MSTQLSIEIANAERIIVPSGDDNEQCIDAFQAEFNIEVPRFEGKNRKVRSQGKDFYKMKGIDIPRYIADGCAEIGLTGTDSAKEDPGYQRDFKTMPIGSPSDEPMCKFVLLAEIEMAPWARSFISQPNITFDRVEEALTSFPRNLMRDVANLGLPIMPSGSPVRGGVERAAELRGFTLAADLVVSGDSARENEMEQIKVLSFVYPAIITRATTAVECEGEFYANR